MKNDENSPTWIPEITDEVEAEIWASFKRGDDDSFPPLRPEERIKEEEYHCNLWVMSIWRAMYECERPDEDE